MSEKRNQMDSISQKIYANPVYALLRVCQGQTFAGFRFLGIFALNKNLIAKQKYLVHLSSMKGTH